METKAQTTVNAVKQLGGEVSAWEHRVSFLTSEASGLKRKNDQVKVEIESALALAQQELDKKRTQAREEMTKVNEATEILKAQQEEFKVMLTAFKKEKSHFENDRSRVLDMEKDLKVKIDKASNFILWVKREAEKL